MDAKLIIFPSHLAIHAVDLLEKPYPFPLAGAQLFQQVVSALELVQAFLEIIGQIVELCLMAGLGTQQPGVGIEGLVPEQQFFERHAESCRNGRQVSVDDVDFGGEDVSDGGEDEKLL